ncbi:MAG TPA: hypothetical protein VGR22_10695 [Thermomicrobiales bacterium]|nr:hypothetical protein [Thermomicrobiales bacterium]
MNAGMRDLLSHIVARYATTEDERRIELDANAEESGADIEADKAAAVERERQLASEQGDAFARGLTLAWERARRGGKEITFDDRQPDQNAMASALVDYLVRFDLASSRSREVGDHHYLYDIAVDWDRLRDVAEENGQRLDDVFDTSHGAA